MSPRGRRGGALEAVEGPEGPAKDECSQEDCGAPPAFSRTQTILQGSP